MVEEEVSKVEDGGNFHTLESWWIEREIGSGKRRRRRTEPTVVRERNHQLGGEKSEGDAIAVDIEVNML